jgi:hypothetical protein
MAGGSEYGTAIYGTDVYAASVHPGSVITDAAAAIVAAMGSRTGYRSCWTAGDGIPVYHSVEAGMQGEAGHAVPVLLIVMDTGDPEQPAASADSSSVPGGLGAVRERIEEASIECRAVAQSVERGQGVVQQLADAAMSVVDDVDAELRSGIGPRLGLPHKELVATFGGVTAIRPHLGGGTYVEIEFSIRVRARL